VSVITTISSGPHGDSRTHAPRIAIEKAGIVKEGGSLALGVGPGEARHAILDIAAERGATVSILGEGRARAHARDRARRNRIPAPHGFVRRNASHAARGEAPGAERGARRARRRDLSRPSACGPRSPPRSARDPRDALARRAPSSCQASRRSSWTPRTTSRERPRWPRRCRRSGPGRRSCSSRASRETRRTRRSSARSAARRPGFVLTRFHGEARHASGGSPPPRAPAHLDCEAVPDPMEALGAAKRWALAANGAVVLTGSLYLIGEALPLSGPRSPVRSSLVALLVPIALFTFVLARRGAGSRGPERRRAHTTSPPTASRAPPPRVRTSTRRSVPRGHGTTTVTGDSALIYRNPRARPLPRQRPHRGRNHAHVGAGGLVRPAREARDAPRQREDRGRLGAHHGTRSALLPRRTARSSPAAPVSRTRRGP
jgi:hypothetical protein